MDRGETQKRHHVKTEAENAVVSLQAKDRSQPPKDRRSHGIIFYCLQRRDNSKTL